MKDCGILKKISYERGFARGMGAASFAFDLKKAKIERTARSAGRAHHLSIRALDGGYENATCVI